MAGDWLKVEKDTPSKPEVKNIAKRMGITPEEAFGRLFRVWSWFDSQSRDGHVVVTDLSSIDDEARMPGFGQAMAEERWLVPHNGGLSLPNFDRHNGKSAKNRALASERKANQRSRDGHAEPVTREEKRRVSPSLRSGEGRGSRLAADWVLPKAWGEWALTEQPTWNAEHCRKIAEMFANHWHSKAGRDACKTDWEKTWRNWVIKEGPKPLSRGASSSPQAWKPGGEPQSVLIEAGARLRLKWHEPPNEGETIGQFRQRIIEAGGEKLLRPGGLT